MKSKKTNKEKNKRKSNKPNYTVVAGSILALGFIYLTFAYSWLFIIPAVILSGINFRLLSLSKK